MPGLSMSTHGRPSRRRWPVSSSTWLKTKVMSLIGVLSWAVRPPTAVLLRVAGPGEERVQLALRDLACREADRARPQQLLGAAAQMAQHRARDRAAEADPTHARVEQ